MHGLGGGFVSVAARLEGIAENRKSKSDIGRCMAGRRLGRLAQTALRFCAWMVAPKRTAVTSGRIGHGASN